jgi:hypothetical protein
MKTVKVGIKDKSKRILKLEHDVAKLKTDNEIMQYVINELKQRIYELEIRTPLTMQPQPYLMNPIISNSESTPTKVETHNYSYGYCYD